MDEADTLTNGNEGCNETKAAAPVDDRSSPRGGPRATSPTRQAEIRAAADRHSRRVRRLKIFVPIFAVLVAAAIIGYSWIESRLLVGIDMKKVLFSKDGLTMVEPRLTGHAGDRSYDVTAAKAVQGIQNPKIIDLEGIDGRIEMADSSWAKVEATKGRYDGTLERLDLEGDVQVHTSNGWRAKGSAAQVDLTAGDITTDRRIRITGPTAWIESDAVTFTEGGHHIVFTGAVVMEVQPTDKSAAPTPNQSPPPSAPPSATR